MMYIVKSPKKLIEVALPLDAINAASAAEKQPGIGAHPRGLHLWWARRPLSAARAVLFAQLVNDPGYQQGGGFRYGVNKEKATQERERLFGIIEDLVKWENTNNEEVWERARAEIWRSWRETCELNKDHPRAAELFDPTVLPAFHDPFAGGGAIPLEAQRLGLESFASDLNPVAVTINRAMIDLPARFAGRGPVGPIAAGQKQQAELHEEWPGALGMAEDVRRYGDWVLAQAKMRAGSFYPKITISHELALERPDLKPLLGQSLTVAAWVWARTVKSPNPAFSHACIPLVSTFMLSSGRGKDAYVEPVVEGDTYKFKVRMGTPPEKGGDGTVNRKGATCLLSASPVDFKYLRAEAKAGRFGFRMMAIIAEGPRGRVFLSPTSEHEEIASAVQISSAPSVEICHWPGRTNVVEYGMSTFGSLFTPRQLQVLNTLTDLIPEAIAQCRADAVRLGMPDDGLGMALGGTGATAYAEAIGVYLAFAVDRLADYGSSIATWKPSGEQVMQTFKRQAIPMTWDFPESNFFANKAICFTNAVKYTSENLRATCERNLSSQGHAIQEDAQTQTTSQNKVVSTDPPYYDNIGYADLSDFFYVWLRRSLRSIYPDLYATVAVPKAEELVATPYRHGSKGKAESFFLDGMTRALRNLAAQAHPAFPVTVYYAFKQSETSEYSGTSNTGWETFLEAVIRAGFALTGTWPMRTELSNRMIGAGSNALASSIILVCRKRMPDARTVSRREFLRELNMTLPNALDEMTRGGINSPVAPVDLSQAIIGPGMAIFSQFAAVLEADGTQMRVKTALQLINRFFAEDDFDHDTQFCLHWFEQQGWATGKFGEADVLARAKGTSVSGLQTTGVVKSGGGDLRLLRWTELPREWSPETDTRLSVWEALHHLIRLLNQDGESAAGASLARMPSRAESTRALAYRLYTLCERKGWVDDARAYNELVTAWSAIELAAGEAGVVGAQAHLDI